MNHLSVNFEEDWFTYPTVYKIIVDRCRLNGKILELGAWKGRSSFFLVTEAKNKSSDIEVHIVDSWSDVSDWWKLSTLENGEDVFAKFKINMSSLTGFYKCHRMDSCEASKLFEDGSLDGVFIDADHSYEAVKRDIQLWLPKIKRGGTLAGHDIEGHPNSMEVIKAVRELLSDVFVMERCWIKFI